MNTPRVREIRLCISSGVLCVDINKRLLDLGLLKTERYGECLILREKKNQEVGEDDVTRGFAM